MKVECCFGRWDTVDFYMGAPTDVVWLRLLEGAKLFTEVVVVTSVTFGVYNEGYCIFA